MLHSSHACQCTVFRNKVINIMRMDQEAHEKETGALVRLQVTNQRQVQRTTMHSTVLHTCLTN